MEGTEESSYVEPVIDNGTYEFDNVQPLGGLGYACQVAGAYNTHGCYSEATPCGHTYSSHTFTAAPTPITGTTTHNMFASL